QAVRCLPLPQRDHAPHTKKPLLTEQGLPLPQRTQILKAEEALEKTVPEPTEYEEQVGRHKQIRADATAMVLAELLPEPEPGAEKAPEHTPMEQHLQEIRDLMYDA
ncbi:hypothetical protein, partial [Streptomyces stelliscabiei]|uniref:hypothetical protein n=1 Tax=Streptomyces stelliscabiei TaxID=146820 RepID=UPI0029A0F859